VGTLPSGFGAAVVNPNVADRVIFYYASNGVSLGLYENSSLSATGATLLVSPAFDDIPMIQLTPDGSTIVFIGSLNGSLGLYTVPASGGTPTYLAGADTAALSPSGSTIVFSQGTTNGEAIMTIPTVGGPATTVTDGTYVDLFPQFSKAGTSIVFSSNRAGSTYDLYTYNLSSSSLNHLQNNSGASEFGASFNGSDTELSFVVISGDLGVSGVYTSNTDGSGATRVYQSDSIGQSTYWTGANGRGLGRSYPLYQRIKRKRSR
jgi:Tol biopolymer transport system component